MPGRVSVYVSEQDKTAVQKQLFDRCLRARTKDRTMDTNGQLRFDRYFCVYAWFIEEGELYRRGRIVHRSFFVQERTKRFCDCGSGKDKEFLWLWFRKGLRVFVIVV